MQVFGLEWNPYEASHGAPSQFATFGDKHAKIWTLQKQVYVPEALLFGTHAKQDVMAAQWLPPAAGSSECLLALGLADGGIGLFRRVLVLPSGACQLQETCILGHTV